MTRSIQDISISISVLSLSFCLNVSGWSRADLDIGFTVSSLSLYRFPIWELSTPFKEEQTPFFGEYHGKVSNVTSTGNGFVDCPALKTEYGQDPFVHSNIMRLCQLRLGDMINFKVGGSILLIKGY